MRRRFIAALALALAIASVASISAAAAADKSLKGYAARLAQGESNLAGVVPELAAKVREIVAACQTRVVAGVSNRYIAGHGPRSKNPRISLHASGKAVDVAGDPGCIYGHLKGWRGGYSVDYAAVRHVHISLDVQGRREMGARFVHAGGTKKARTRYAAAGVRRDRDP